MTWGMPALKNTDATFSLWHEFTNTSCNDVEVAQVAADGGGDFVPENVSCRSSDAGMRCVHPTPSSKQSAARAPRPWPEKWRTYATIKECVSNSEWVCVFG